MLPSRHHTPAFQAKHRFFAKTQAEQSRWLRHVVFKALAMNALIVLLAIIATVFITPLALLLPIASIWVSILLLASFFDVPSLAASGKLIYLSTMLIAEPKAEDHIVLHGGTLFDYWCVLDRNTHNSEKSHVLHEFVQGLLYLLDETQDQPGSVVVDMTTYFIREQTAKRLGFDCHKPTPLSRLILMGNITSLMVSQYLVTKRWRWPKLNQIRRMQTTLTGLRASRNKLERLQKAIQSE